MIYRKENDGVGQERPIPISVLLHEITRLFHRQMPEAEIQFSRIDLQRSSGSSISIRKPDSEG